MIAKRNNKILKTVICGVGGMMFGEMRMSIIKLLSKLLNEYERGTYWEGVSKQQQQQHKHAKYFRRLAAAGCLLTRNVSRGTDEREVEKRD